MTGPRLRRDAGHGRAAAPVRLVHLGLGNFYRAHQAWYTDHAPDAAEWGYAAFSGLGRGDLPDRLSAQDGLYTLVTRAADADSFEVISSLSRAHSALDHAAWLDYFRSPQLAIVTLTVTEAGYLRGPDGGLDAARPQVQADLATLRDDPQAVVHTTPGRLVAGLAARRASGAGPLAIVPCDNVPGNGAIAERVVRQFAELLDPTLTEWLDTSLSVVTTTVDRITPRGGPDDVRTVLESTGVDDRCPVVTEPFTEWVLSGRFPSGHPGWAAAGATFTDDVTPFEHRKLWLLNAAHSLLAYAGSIRGHETVADAVADDTCRDWLEQWWTVAAPHLGQPEQDVTAYRAALLDRFANPRIRHQLAQIAADGSQKLPLRVLPVLRPSVRPTGCPRPPPGSWPPGSAPCADWGHRCPTSVPSSWCNSRTARCARLSRGCWTRSIPNSARTTTWSRPWWRRASGSQPRRPSPRTADAGGTGSRPRWARRTCRGRPRRRPGPWRQGRGG